MLHGRVETRPSSLTYKSNLLLRGQRAEDVVPQRRRDAEAAVVIREVVRQVMAAEELAPARRRREVVHEVVRAVVEEVADDEAGEERLADGACPG